jgi:hypothetical protein
MRFLVKIVISESIHGAEDVSVRKAVGEQIQKIVNSGKMESGGAFADMCGGYFVLNVDSSTDLRELIGLALLANAHIECHPLTSFEELMAFFKKNAAVTNM